MTYTFKLARRLAVLRDCAMLAILAIVAACTGDTTTAPDGAESSPSQAAILTVSPRIVTAETNQAVRFRGQERTFRGEAVTSTTAWSSTGGTITATGTFSSSLTGTFKVIGRGRGRKTDTAVVIVVPPATDITSLVVSPTATTLATGASHAFSATAYLADGSTTPIGVNWSATGGQIDAAGAYTAGTTPGTFRVIAANTAGTLADTAAVAIDAPAPTLTNVYVTPASVSLSAGATQAFKAYGRNSAGDSIPVTVAFSATGGTVSSSGLYTAGSTGGTFRLVAKESTTGAADTSAVTVVAATSTGTQPTDLGIPFGPFGLWDTYKTVKSGPAPFTMSQNATDPAGIVTQISSARQMGQKLVLAMTGGPHTATNLGCCLSIVNGVAQFDMAKWKGRMDLFNTSAIKTAIAGGVADGTIIGNAMIDEPEVTGGGDGNTWGPTGWMTKAKLDEMATYGHSIFPTLPMGVNHGPSGYQWRTSEHYHVVDYVLNQYAWRIGAIGTWLSAVRSQFQTDGVALGFSINTLGGGVQDRDGNWTCDGPGQAGLGPYNPTCRTPADSLRVWGRTLVPAGCVMLMWRYDATYMGRSDNQQAFRDIATTAAATPRKDCRRP
jgi:hypothetical protein